MTVLHWGPLSRSLLNLCKSPLIIGKYLSWIALSFSYRKLITYIKDGKITCFLFTPVSVIMMVMQFLRQLRFLVDNDLDW